ncbi:lactate dehydrogenase [Williamsoniiplasma somnilux]|uniref:Lactate dehydrogenase n=1 Tax=Williamsoniiplasma somnilux TaxID=215578 RepID=A0A2K8NYQ4_9MOLU|nr:NAD(P)-dependent oxidoreductase [Williamsoniiplasma somnilux]ATZ18927.1 lactate dehydrogenase [Williamsoniiplasma somnilux]
MKIFCYGIQDAEKSIFELENKKFKNELFYTNDLLNSENIKNFPNGMDAVILFVNCKADEKALKTFKEKGVKYIVTRTVGTDHIDLKTAASLGYKVGRVPSYSPTAVASLAFAGGIELLRRSGWMFNQTKDFNFKIDGNMFAKELKNSTIGIIGTGKIGYETAKYWKGTGAKVLGFDLFPNDKNNEVLEYTDLETLIKKSELISLHVPYIKGENENLINEALISKMKDFASIVNVSRAPLVDTKAIISAIKSNKLYGYAGDVFTNEGDLINKKLTEADVMKINPEIVELLKLYPRVLISPHVAYFTDEAVKNMAEISFQNLKQLVETGTCDTAVN